MRLAVISASFLLLSFEPSSAVPGVLDRAPDAKACFERTYDRTHLARNPAQTVTRIRVSVSREIIPGTIGLPPTDFIRVELTRRGVPQIHRIIGWCERPFGGEKLDARGQVTNWDTDGRRCMITKEDPMNAEEDDSHGHVDIEPDDVGLFMRLSTSVRLRTGEKVSVDKGRMVKMGVTDRTFLLTKVPAARCDDLRRAIREE
jgi:hypothetical protein